MGETLLKCLVLLCTLLALMMANNVELSAAKVLQQFSWDVKYMKWAPDCKESIVMGINGMFPGPTIRAKAGDTIQVNVTNKLATEGVVIHWHGIRQLGTPWADGTASISQCPINPGETFTYRFIVDKAGTHFYHGHYGMQRSAGLYGSLIVDVGDGEKEPFHYNSELSVLLSDWWHLGTREQGVRLSSNPVHWIGEPQTLLINGRGQFDCSLAASKSFLDRIKELFGAKKSLEKCKFTGTETCAPPILYVDPNKTYRLRIVSTTSLVPLNLQIENHKMTVVEADGNYVEPFDVTDLDIYSGETYSVLLKTDQNPSSNYWVSVGVRGRKPNTTQALTILNYRPLPALDNLPKTQPPITPHWNDYTHSKSFANKSHGLLNSSTYNSPPTIYHRRIILLNTQNTINGYTKWSINNVSLALPSTPYLGAIKFGLKDAFDQNRPAEDFSKDYNISSKPTNPNANYGNAPYMLRHWEIVDVVLQNANVLYHMDSEIHPWHLHGHDFWVLGYGEGRFEAEIHEKSFNLVNPPLKNTVVIFPYGWTAFRFVANNPGVWAFHCHIEAHLFMGMGVVFAEAVEKIGQVPGEAMACGLTATTAIKSTKLIKP